MNFFVKDKETTREGIAEYLTVKGLMLKLSGMIKMLTAMDDEYTQIMGFEEQADDYMSKPFSLAMLEKRIKDS